MAPGESVFHRSLRIAVCDAVASNREVLALWIMSEAQALRVPCDVEQIDPATVPPAPPDVSVSSGCPPIPDLLFIAIQAQRQAEMTDAAQMAQSFVCRYGCPGDRLVGTGAAYTAPWPMKRAQVRRMLALCAATAAVVNGHDDLSAHAPRNAGALGNAVVPELIGLVPKLLLTVSALLQECRTARDAQAWSVGGNAAHALKGAAMSFGQLVFAEVAQHLQDGFAQADDAVVDGAMALLHGMLPETG